MTTPPQPAPRGESLSVMRTAVCKDCQREAVLGLRTEITFTYNDAWAEGLIERGGSRTDRCREHRTLHQAHINGMAVAHIDLETVGVASGADDNTVGPQGPLGGLGPLPGLHQRVSGTVDLDQFGFGMDQRHIEEMLGFLQDDEQRVLVVKAGTGTGKSTYMPYRLLDPPAGCFRLADLGPIVVTEPRVQATVGVAGFVGQRMSGAGGVGPGFPVGYQVKGDRNHDAACQLVFVTDGTVINWMREGRLSNIGTIIVDEAHERSTNIDFILGFLKQNLDHYPHLRVIVTSATFNADFYVEYFADLGDGRVRTTSDGRPAVNKVDVPAQKSIGYGFPLFPELDLPLTSPDAVQAWERSCPELKTVGSPDDASFVQTHWTTSHAAPLGLDDLSESLQHEVGWVEDLHDTTRRLLAHRYQGPLPKPDAWRREMPAIVGNAVVKLVNGLDVDGIFGDVLAFLPTTAVIQEACEMIRRGVNDRADVFALLSTLSPEEKADALDPRKKGDRRKIVVSSNLAETSLTVEGVRFVVDSGLICQEEWDPNTASRTLPSQPHSQSGIKQRWGRVGRKAPGWVFPLYSKDQYAALAEDTRPGSTRCNLESMTMTAKMGGVDDVLSFPWPASFTPTTVTLDASAEEGRKIFVTELARAATSLLESGAVDADGDPTSFGKELARLSWVGTTAGAIAIMYADRLACVPEVVTLLSLMDGQRLAGAKGLLMDSDAWPAEWRVEAFERHRAIYEQCEDDADAVLQIVGAWERADPNKAPWEPSMPRLEFAREMWINHDRLLLLAQQRREVLESLSSNLSEEVKRFVEPSLLRRARGAISRAMGSHRYRRTDGDQFVAAGGATDNPINGGDAASGSVVSENRTLTVADDIIPLLRSSDGDTGNHRLDNVVTFEGWAERDPSSNRTGAADALDLLLAAAAHGAAEPRRDLLCSILVEWPPGLRARLTLATIDGDQRATTHEVRRPAEMPQPPSEPAPEDALDIGTDLNESDVAELDRPPEGGWPTPNEKIPDDEDAQRRMLLDIRAEELDANGCGYCEACTSDDPVHCSDPIGTGSPDRELRPVARNPVAPTGPGPRVRVIDDDSGGGHDWYEVVGYDLATPGGPTVVVTPDWRRAGVDYLPGEHRDLSPGDLVEVRIGELLRIGRSHVRLARRTDGHGRFALIEVDKRPPEQDARGLVASGLDRRQHHLVASLAEGAIVVGTAIPSVEPDVYGLTLLELLHRHVWESFDDPVAPGQHSFKTPARVVGPLARRYVPLELDLVDSIAGISHRFSVREMSGTVTDIGDGIVIGLAPTPATLPLVDVDIESLRPIAQHLSHEVDLVLPRADAPDPPMLRSRRPISGTLAVYLAEMRPSDLPWRAAVWSFFARSHHLRVDDRVRPERNTRTSEIDRPANLRTTDQAGDLALAQLPVGERVAGVALEVTPDGIVVSLSSRCSAMLPAHQFGVAPPARGSAVVVTIKDVRSRWAEIVVEDGNSTSASAPVAPAVELVLVIRRSSFEQEHGADITLDRKKRTVRIDGPPMAVVGATSALEPFMNASCVLVDVPEQLKKHVIGSGGSTIKELRSPDKVLYLDFDRGSTWLRVLTTDVETLADTVERIQRFLRRGDPGIELRFIDPVSEQPIEDIPRTDRAPVAFTTSERDVRELGASLASTAPIVIASGPLAPSRPATPSVGARGAAAASVAQWGDWYEIAAKSVQDAVSSLGPLGPDVEFEVVRRPIRDASGRVIRTARLRARRRLTATSPDPAGSTASPIDGEIAVRTPDDLSGVGALFLGGTRETAIRVRLPDPGDLLYDSAIAYLVGLSEGGRATMTPLEAGLVEIGPGQPQPRPATPPASSEVRAVCTTAADFHAIVPLVRLGQLVVVELAGSSVDEHAQMVAFCLGLASGTQTTVHIDDRIARFS